MLGAKGRGRGRGRSDQRRFEDTERLLASTVAREARSARSCSLSLRRPRTSVPKPCGERWVGMGAGVLSRVRDGDYLCVLTLGGGGSAVGSSLHGRARHHPVRHQLPTRGQPLAPGGGRSTMGSASAVARGYATTGGVSAPRRRRRVSATRMAGSRARVQIGGGSRSN